MSAIALRGNYELQLPNSYVDVDRDEMEYVDGGDLGIGAACAIIGTAIAATTFMYGAGKVAGRDYYIKYGKHYYRDRATMNAAVNLMGAIHPVLRFAAATFRKGFEVEYFSIIQGI